MLLASLLALAVSAAASPSAPGAPAFNDAGSALQSAAAYDGGRARANAVFAGAQAGKAMPEGLMSPAEALAAKRARLSPLPEMPATFVEPAPEQAPRRLPDPARDALGGLAGAALGLAFGAALAYGFSVAAERAA